MWRIICLPEETTESDIANAIFTGNPDLGGLEEADGIWAKQPTKIPGYPFDISANRPIVIGADPEGVEPDDEGGDDSDF